MRNSLTSRPRANTPRTVNAAGKIHTARALWRLCAATEFVCARLGVKATVADVLKAAGMSRRSFYQFFESLEQAIEVMHNVQLWTLAHKSDPTELATSPGAPWVLLSLDPSRDIGLDASAAFSQARLVKEYDAPRPVPSDKDLIEWAENFDKVAVAA